MVTCSSCGKPLCPDCMVFSAVGIKCRECAKMPRSSRVTLKSRPACCGRWRPGWARARPSASPTTTSWERVGFFFLFFFMAAGIGYLVGEAVLRASGHYHGLQTAVVAAASTVWAFVDAAAVLGLS